MPRQPAVDRPKRLELKLPESLRNRLDLLLYSELEGRVPLGAYQSFFVERIHEYLGNSRLDLQAYGFPEGYHVKGPAEMLAALKSHLERNSA